MNSIEIHKELLKTIEYSKNEFEIKDSEKKLNIVLTFRSSTNKTEYLSINQFILKNFETFQYR